MGKNSYIVLICALLLVISAHARRDPYKVLGLSKGASDDEIKRAYKKLALKYHPGERDRLCISILNLQNHHLLQAL